MPAKDSMLRRQQFNKEYTMESRYQLTVLILTSNTATFYFMQTISMLTHVCVVGGISQMKLEAVASLWISFCDLRSHF